MHDRREMTAEKMLTERIEIDAKLLETAAAQADLRRAAEVLLAGGTVAFATETVYGLGANALDAAAVEKIFEAKQRPSWDPLIVHVADREMLSAVVAEVPENAALLMEKFWPGPLTLLLPRSAQMPMAVTAGRELVGVRMPKHPVAMALIRAAGVPIAAPSANRFGHTSPTTAQHVLDDLDGRIDMVIDSGACEVGVESTVLDAGAVPPVVYRPGAVTLEMLRAGIGEVVLHVAEKNISVREALPSPGVGIRHYAPRARVLLVADREQMMAMQAEQLRAGQRVGVLLPMDWPVPANGLIVVRWAAEVDSAAQAHSLFAALRTLDDLGAEVIVCPLPAAEGIGAALRDRLLKAAMTE